LLDGLGAAARELLATAAVYREPVVQEALTFGVGSRLPPISRSADLAGAIDSCLAMGLLEVDESGLSTLFQVPPAVVPALRSMLNESLLLRAHRRAAQYWQWRVTSGQCEGQGDTHDLVEAHYHLISAGDLTHAELTADAIWARLHSLGEFAREAELIADTMARLPAESPRWPDWAYRRAKAAQLQGQADEARFWHAEALAGFAGRGNHIGMAACHTHLGTMAQASGDYAEAERHYRLAAEMEQAAENPANPPQPSTVSPQPVATGPLRAGEPPLEAVARPRPVSKKIIGGALLLRTRLVEKGLDLAVAALVLMAALTIGVVGTFATAGAARHPAVAGKQLSIAAKTRARVASWIAAQVAKSAIVACDPLMCKALIAARVPPSQLLELSQRSADPLGSDVIIATSAVRDQFGRRLTGVYAPVVLACIGTGRARTEILAMYGNGAGAYATALRADIRARRSAGLQLLHNRHIAASAEAGARLAAGAVDDRLLITLGALAAIEPIRILTLADSGPGAGPGVPLREATIEANTRRGSAKDRSAAALLIRFLRVQRSVLAPAVTWVPGPGGEIVIRILFRAPSPLGLLVDSAIGT